MYLLLLAEIIGILGGNLTRLFVSLPCPEAVSLFYLFQSHLNLIFKFIFSVLPFLNIFLEEMLSNFLIKFFVQPNQPYFVQENSPHFKTPYSRYYLSQSIQRSHSLFSRSHTQQVQLHVVIHNNAYLYFITEINVIAFMFYREDSMIRSMTEQA